MSDQQKRSLKSRKLALAPRVRIAKQAYIGKTAPPRTADWRCSGNSLAKSGSNATQPVAAVPQ
jgi:hypothetical protein